MKKKVKITIFFCSTYMLNKYTINIIQVLEVELVNIELCQIDLFPCLQLDSYYVHHNDLI